MTDDAERDGEVVLITGGAGFLGRAIVRELQKPVREDIGAKLLRPIATLRPNLTRSSVQIVCQDFTFTGEKARRELGYAPVYSKSEALEHTIRHFSRYGPNP